MVSNSIDMLSKNNIGFWKISQETEIRHKEFN